MISICEKVTLKQLWKVKDSTVAQYYTSFKKVFFTEPHTFLYHALGKSHDFLISCFRSGQMFLKLWLFEKINFVILFLNKIKPCLIWWISHWYCVSKQETSFICSNMIDQMGFSGDDWLVEVYLSSVLTLVDNVWLVFFFSGIWCHGVIGGQISMDKIYERNMIFAWILRDSQHHAATFLDSTGLWIITEEFFYFQKL